MVGCLATAEDLVQDTYVRVATALADRPIRHLPAFLHQTARNLALDHLRKVAVRRDVPDNQLALDGLSSPGPDPEQAAGFSRQVERLEAVLAELPARRREILLLHKIHGWRHSDIAHHYGITVSAVEKNLRQALAQCLAVAGDVDE